MRPASYLPPAPPPVLGVVATVGDGLLAPSAGEFPGVGEGDVAGALSASNSGATPIAMAMARTAAIVLLMLVGSFISLGSLSKTTAVL